MDGERATMLLSTAPLLFLQRLKENQGSAKKTEDVFAKQKKVGEEHSVLPKNIKYDS